MVTSSEVAQRYRRQLMRKHTPGERTMKKLLKSLKLRFKQQYIVPSPISFYLLDFFISDLRIAIEVDGDHHQFNPRQREWDMIRDKYLKSIGIQVIRINNYALTNSKYESTKKWLDKMIKRLRFKQIKLL